MQPRALRWGPRLAIKEKPTKPNQTKPNQTKLLNDMIIDPALKFKLSIEHPTAVDYEAHPATYDDRHSV